MFRRQLFESGQKWLMDRLAKLGYTNTDGGYCFGISYLKVKAMLEGKVDAFLGGQISLSPFPPCLCVPASSYKLRS